MISNNLLVLVVQSFSFFDFIYSREYNKECKCVDGNGSDVKPFTGYDQYWCCKAPNTECTYGICQGKKLPLSQQCHDDTKITVYQGEYGSTLTRIPHPRCNHYPSSSRGDFYAGASYLSRSFIDVCRDNRYDLNSAKCSKAKVGPIIRNFIWVKMELFW